MKSNMLFLTAILLFYYIFPIITKSGLVCLGYIFVIHRGTLLNTSSFTWYIVHKCVHILFTVCLICAIRAPVQSTLLYISETIISQHLYFSVTDPADPERGESTTEATGPGELGRLQVNHRHQPHRAAAQTARAPRGGATLVTQGGTDALRGGTTLVTQGGMDAQRGGNTIMTHLMCTLHESNNTGRSKHCHVLI